MKKTVHIRGELYLTLDAVADCYHLEVSWVREVYEFDLLGSGEQVSGEVVVPARMLDRIADIRRMHLQTGLDLAAIAWLMLR